MQTNIIHTNTKKYRSTKPL